MSKAILAAPYAAFQTDSLDDLGSLSAGSAVSQNEEAIDRAMALDEAASALRSLERRGRSVVSSCFKYSTTGDVGVDGGLFAGGVAPDEDFFRK